MSENSGVGMPATMWLDQFGSLVWDAFGEIPYLVGSVLRKQMGEATQWRDVDVRVILSDEDYERHGYGDPDRGQRNARWVAQCLAFSALGKHMTGLPIDFQIQQRTHANKTYDEPRSALGFVPLRFRDEAHRPIVDTLDALNRVGGPDA